MRSNPAPDARFILIYTNDDGTTTSHRLWTLEQACHLLNTLPATTRAGGWSIHETNEVET